MNAIPHREEYFPAGEFKGVCRLCKKSRTCDAAEQKKKDKATSKIHIGLFWNGR
jgi:hypothetical protein